MAGLASGGAVAPEPRHVERRRPPDRRPRDEALRGRARYEWLVFTSANAVEAVSTRMAALGVGLPAGLSLASVGPATPLAVHAAWPGARVSVEPAGDFRAAGLVAAFDPAAGRGRRVLLPVSDRAAETVSRGLAERGAVVERVVAYRTVSADGGQSLAETLRGGVDVAVFASPSAVEAFAAFAGEDGRSVPAAVIAPPPAEAPPTPGATAPPPPPPAPLDAPPTPPPPPRPLSPPPPPP